MTFDPDAFHYEIDKRREFWERERIKPALIRIWDGMYELYAEVAGHLAEGFKFIDNDTGTAYLRFGLDHHVAKWAIDHKGREKANVHVTFDKQGVRWSGFMDHYAIRKEKDGTRYVEIVFKHDYENAKHIYCWSNPFLLAELQFPRVWMLFGKSKWALETTLLVNIMRLESSIWMLPDDPMDPAQWWNFDQSTWSMVVKPSAYVDDDSDPCFVFSRFKSFHDVAKRIVADAQLSITCRRYLPGDPLPWPGANLRYGCLVWEIIDQSGWRSGTAFSGGNMLSGLLFGSVDIDSDGLTENIDYITNPNIPTEYYEPGNPHGTVASMPYVILEEGPYTGIESSEFLYYPATDVQVVVGGHSMPGVNEGISAAIIGIGGFLGSLFGQSQIGPAIDAVLKPLYTDTVLAFQAWKSPQRAQRLGDFHLHERFQDGADRAYTLAALAALRSGMFQTREHTAHSIKIADAVPYRIGGPGYGDYFVGSRICVSILGQPEHMLFVEQVMSVEWSADSNGPSGWQIEVGHREPEDPFLKSLEIIRELAAGFHELGLV